MQPNKRIGIVPMPTWSMVSVDHDDRSIAVPDQCVGECHPSRTATNNDIVCFNGCSHVRIPSVAASWSDGRMHSEPHTSCPSQASIRLLDSLNISSKIGVERYRPGVGRAPNLDAAATPAAFRGVCYVVSALIQPRLPPHMTRDGHRRRTARLRLSAVRTSVAIALLVCSTLHNIQVGAVTENMSWGRS